VTITVYRACAQKCVAAWASKAGHTIPNTEDTSPEPPQQKTAWGERTKATTRKTRCAPSPTMPWRIDAALCVHTFPVEPLSFFFEIKKMERTHLLLFVVLSLTRAQQFD
jgi:hypothetical protein